MASRSLLAALCLTAVAHAPAWAGQPSLLPAVKAFALEAQDGNGDLPGSMSAPFRPEEGGEEVRGYI